MNKLFFYCNVFVCIGSVSLVAMDEPPCDLQRGPLVPLFVSPPPPSSVGDSLASPGASNAPLVDGFSRLSVTSPQPGAASSRLSVSSSQSCTTPLYKRAKSPVSVSPQNVALPAANTAREIFQSLTKKVEDEEIIDKLVCADRPEAALKALLGWYSRFPSILTKIKWYTPVDQREEIQQDFKYKLAAALQQTVLRCLALSGNPRLSEPEIAYEGDNACTSQVTLGGFLITSSVSKATLMAKQAIFLVDKSRPMPEYDSANRVKNALMGYLFDPSDMSSDFQGVLQDILSAIPLDKRMPKEQFYHALIYGIIHFMGSNFSMVEAYSGDGRADLLLVGAAGNFTGNQNCIIELKYNRSAKEAVDQIKAMDYGRYFHPGSVIAVGINIKGQPFGVTASKEIIQIKQPEITITESGASGTVSWQ